MTDSLPTLDCKWNTRKVLHRIQDAAFIETIPVVVVRVRWERDLKAAAITTYANGAQLGAAHPLHSRRCPRLARPLRQKRRRHRQRHWHRLGRHPPLGMLGSAA